jgi:hypothetical protein
MDLFGPTCFQANFGLLNTQNIIVTDWGFSSCVLAAAVKDLFGPTYFQANFGLLNTQNVIVTNLGFSSCGLAAAVRELPGWTSLLPGQLWIAQH